MRSVFTSTSVSNTAVAWQQVGEWANLTMMTVALIVVVVGVWLCTKALRRTVNEFEQGKLDARNDKLRAEIIDLINALSARPSPVDAIINRIAALTDKIDPADRSASKDQIKLNAKAAVSGALSGTYRQIYGHSIAIVMLTDDEAVADPVRRIMKAAEQELQALEAIIAGSDGVTDEQRRCVDELHQTTQDAMLELVHYGLKNLRVAA